MIAHITEYTVPEKILLAADQLDKDGQSPFSAEALIVAAWQKFPKTFGLKGYADQYPDSNKVLSSIMGEKGLARRGWLIKMGQKVYSLTREGRQALRRMLRQEEAPEPPPSNLRLPRDQERALLNLLESSAAAKFEEGRKQELTFADACRFWGITENLRGDALDGRLRQLEDSLAEFERLLADSDAELTGGRVVSAGDLRVLGNMHRYMEDRFGRHLTLLRSRGKR
ncbi:MAG: hypothetical protein L0Z62_40525 [Gemmataceae bacterium]|nr:hypothetical protein [Gemmataceae bacterium]